MFVKTRAGKKKWLTDRVSILPFPNQSLRNKVAAPVKNAPPVKEPIQLVEQPIVLSQPAGSVNTQHISIKKMIEEDSKKEIVLQQENLPREGFKKEHLQVVWKRFAFKIKDQGMDTFYHALVKRDPLFITDEKLAIVVDNSIQQDYIKPLLPDFIAYLREQLKNHWIDVEIVFSDKPDEELKYLTGKDKFNALARKNPNLHTLKNLFNLDIEL